MLDIDYGIYFYVISSNIGFGGVVIGFVFDYKQIKEVIGVVKVYIVCFFYYYLDLSYVVLIFLLDQSWWWFF